MKRSLCSLLCAVLLLAAAPIAAPPAMMVTDGSLRSSVSTATVGDMFIWYANARGVWDELDYSFRIYRNGSLCLPPKWGNYDEGLLYFIPTVAGTYTASVSITDPIPLENQTEPTSITLTGAPVVVRPFPAPRITKVQPIGGTALALSWEKVEGATGYEVWWNTSSSGTYRLAKTTASTSFTKTYLQPGARYFFKVRAYQTVVNKWIAYGDRAYGDFSPAVSGVPLAKPVILSAVSAARGRVSLAWAAVAGAGGYRISAAPTPAGTYAPLAATGGTAYTLTGLRPGTVYYFTVTAFRKYYTATYYGPESGYKGVKTRVR